MIASPFCELRAVHCERFSNIPLNVKHKESLLQARWLLIITHLKIITKIVLIIFFTINSVAEVEALSSYAYTSESFVVAREIVISGKVVELDMTRSNMEFVISWIDSNGRAWEKRHISIRGQHLYEMRDHRMWRGFAKVISVNNDSVISGGIILPSVNDEFSIFFLPELWLRSSVNALWGHTLFGFSFTFILSLLMGSISLIIFFINKMKTPLLLSLFFGFIFSWIVMDCRTIYDHYLIFKNIKENLSIRQTEGLRFFFSRLSETIGEKSWTKKDLPVIAAINLDYSLAEHKYSLGKEYNDANFIITEKDGQIILLPGAPTP